MTKKADYAIYYDSSMCTNCKGCQVACKCWNNLPSPIELNACADSFTGTYQNPPDINGTTRLIQEFREYESPETPLKPIAWAFTRRSCKHCTDAGCVKVCPAGALTHDEATGFVKVQSEKCIACHYCQTACPFDVPRYDERERNGIINKCTGCLDRVAQGMKPACVTTCQPEALDYGPRDEMLKKAHERVEWLHERGFADACVYGENEMGGLHVISVLKYGVEKHGEVENPSINPLAYVMPYVAPVTGGITCVVIAGLAFFYLNGVGYSRENLRYNPETGDVVDIDTGQLVKHVDPAEVAKSAEHWHVEKTSTRTLRRHVNDKFETIDGQPVGVASKSQGEKDGE